MSSVCHGLGRPLTGAAATVTWSKVAAASVAVVWLVTGSPMNPEPVPPTVVVPIVVHWVPLLDTAALTELLVRTRRSHIGKETVVPPRYAVAPPAVVRCMN